MTMFSDNGQFMSNCNAKGCSKHAHAAQFHRNKKYLFWPYDLRDVKDSISTSEFLGFILSSASIVSKIKRDRVAEWLGALTSAAHAVMHGVMVRVPPLLGQLVTPPSPPHGRAARQFRANLIK